MEKVYLELVSATVLSSFSMAVTAENRPIAIWLEGQFRNLCSTLGASPLALVHLSITEATFLVIHLIWFTWYFVEPAPY